MIYRKNKKIHFIPVFPNILNVSRPGVKKDRATNKIANNGLYRILPKGRSKFIAEIVSVKNNNNNHSGFFISNAIVMINRIEEPSIY